MEKQQQELFMLRKENDELKAKLEKQNLIIERLRHELEQRKSLEMTSLIPTVFVDAFHQLANIDKNLRDFLDAQSRTPTSAAPTTTTTAAPIHHSSSRNNHSNNSNINLPQTTTTTTTVPIQHSAAATLAAATSASSISLALGSHLAIPIEVQQKINEMPSNSHDTLLFRQLIKGLFPDDYLANANTQAIRDQHPGLIEECVKFLKRKKPTFRITSINKLLSLICFETRRKYKRQSTKVHSHSHSHSMAAVDQHQSGASAYGYYYHHQHQNHHHNNQNTNANNNNQDEDVSLNDSDFNEFSNHQI